MKTAIAAVLRFYKGAETRETIRNTTPEQFAILVGEIETVAKLEQGESTPVPSAEMLAQIRRDPLIRNKCGAR